MTWSVTAAPASITIPLSVNHALSLSASLPPLSLSLTHTHETPRSLSFLAALIRLTKYMHSPQD